MQLLREHSLFENTKTYVLEFFIFTYLDYFCIYLSGRSPTQDKSHVMPLIGIGTHNASPFPLQWVTAPPSVLPYQIRCNALVDESCSHHTALLHLCNHMQQTILVQLSVFLVKSQINMSKTQQWLYCTDMSTMIHFLGPPPKTLYVFSQIHP